MRRILLLIYVLFQASPTYSHDINDYLNRIKKLDSFFIEYATTGNRSILFYNEQQYEFFQFTEVIDSFFSHVQSFSTPRPCGINLDFTKYSIELRSLVKTINNTAPTEENYKASIGEVREYFKKLKNDLEKKCAYNYLLFHYGNLNASFFDSLKSIHLGKAKNAKEFAEENLMRADLNSNIDLAASLLYYDWAYIYFDSVNDKKELAEIDAKIGLLLMQRDIPAYIKLGEKHLQDSYLQLSSSNDSLQRIENSLKHIEAISDWIGLYDISNFEVFESKFRNDEILKDSLKTRQSLNLRNTIIDKCNVLEVARYAVSSDSEKKDLASLSIAMGNYFFSKNLHNASLSQVETNLNYTVAFLYYKAAVVYAFLYENNADDIYKGLINLSTRYMMSSKATEAMKYANYATLLAFKQKNNSMIAKLYVLKGRILKTSNNYTEAVTSVKNGILISNQIVMSKIDKVNLLQDAYRTLFNSYQAIGNVDSTVYYQKKYFDLRTSLLVEFDDVMQVESQTIQYLSDRQIKLRESKMRLITITTCSIIAVLLTVSFVGYKVYKIKIAERDKQNFDTRSQLNALAKGKIHNLKGTYMSFINLISKNDPERALLFANRSTAYLSASLDDVNWEHAKWTVEQEINLLKTYVVAAEVLWPNIKMVYKIENEVILMKSALITEVFTTLLHNSIIHNFQYVSKQRLCTFTIHIIKKGEWIECVITDDGMHFSSDIKYIRDDKPDKGLSLLKRRIEAEINLKRMMKKGLTFFSAGPRDKYGSKIKFILPYAVAT